MQWRRLPDLLRSQHHYTRKSDERISTTKFCEEQFHLRIWGDYNINGGKGHEKFSAAVIYHEHPIFCSKCDPPESKDDVVNHKADGWEDPEDILLKQLADSKGRHEGDRHGDSLCVFGDYRRVPEQRPGKYRGAYNNGLISRVSAQHTSGGPDSGCGGA